MDVEQIPYAPFRLSQGFRVGELAIVSGQAAIDVPLLVRVAGRIATVRVAVGTACRRAG